jgi:hypothetical protein
VTVAESKIWLVHPGVPELSMPVELAKGSLAEEEWGVQQGVFYPMGRPFPVSRPTVRAQSPVVHPHRLTFVTDGSGSDQGAGQ